jgi:hypothetical protein
VARRKPETTLFQIDADAFNNMTMHAMTPAPLLFPVLLTLIGN